MTILRPFLLPTVGEPGEVKLTSRSRRNMLEEGFYTNQRKKEVPKVQAPEDEGKVKETFTTEPLTGDYFASQVARMGGRTPPPTLEPGARVRSADINKVSSDSFKPYYEQLKMINQIGQDQLGTAAAVAAYKRLQSINGGGGGAGNPPPVGNANQTKFSGAGSVGQWINEAASILAQSGIQLTDQEKGWIATIIQHESGGNPNAINDWDSNAAAGIPSKGLMQTIDPTFNSNKLPGYDNIYNPIHNIIAGVRYAIRRYGSISNVPGIRNLMKGFNYVGY